MNADVTVAPAPNTIEIWWVPDDKWNDGAVGSWFVEARGMHCDPESGPHLGGSALAAARGKSVKEALMRLVDILDTNTFRFDPTLLPPERWR
jgi:hypothetical protein